MVITPHTLLGTPCKVSSNYPQLTKNVAISDKLLIDDGKIIVQAIRKEGDELVTEVVCGGILRERHMCRYFSQVLSIGALLLQCPR